MEASISFIGAIILILVTNFVALPQGIKYDVKTLSFPAPSFPAEARNAIYGGIIYLSVDVNKKGKVTSVYPFGPNIPCSNLRDPVVETIRQAAMDAAKKIIFEPIVLDGKPTAVNVQIKYYLDPKSTPPAGPTALNPGGPPKGGVLNGKAKLLYHPEYPATARSKRMSGSIEVDVVIGEDGKVISARTNATYSDFAYVSLDAACRSEFTPTLLSGVAVKVTGIITYSFVP